MIDGTTCDLNDDVPRVCVDGECVAVGCDGELGGDKREDKCRVCGGQGDNCNTIEGVLDDKVRLMNDDSKYCIYSRFMQSSSFSIFVNQVNKTMDTFRSC